MDILENYMFNYVEDIECLIWVKFFFLIMFYLDLYFLLVIFVK